MELNVARCRKLYRKYLKGKRVVLVGPAASMMGSGLGKLIDSYDVVVRLKKSLGMLDGEGTTIGRDRTYGAGVGTGGALRQDIGSRCDVLYHSLNFNSICGGWIDIGELRRKGVKFMMGVYPPRELVDGNGEFRYREHIAEFYQKCQRENYDNLGYVEKEWFLKLWTEMGTLGNTGTMAILDLLNSECRELWIVGITFFKGGYIPCYHPNYTEKGIMKLIQEYNIHNPEIERKYVEKVLEEKDRKKMKVHWREKDSVIGNKLRILNNTDMREQLRKIRKADAGTSV